MENEAVQQTTVQSKQSLKRSNKPLVERRRRARINNCLSQLKGIVMHDHKAENPHSSRYEKADILEMTVRLLKKCATEETCGVLKSPNEATTYSAGFNECLSLTQEYLMTSRQLPEDIVSTMFCHLQSRQKETAGDYGTAQVHEQGKDTEQMEQRHKEEQRQRGQSEILTPTKSIPESDGNSPVQSTIRGGDGDVSTASPRSLNTISPMIMTEAPPQPTYSIVLVNSVNGFTNVNKIEATTTALLTTQANSPMTAILTPTVPLRAIPVYMTQTDQVSVGITPVCRDLTTVTSAAMETDQNCSRIVITGDTCATGGAVGVYQLPTREGNVVQAQNINLCERRNPIEQYISNDFHERDIYFWRPW